MKQDKWLYIAAALLVVLVIATALWTVFGKDDAADRTGGDPSTLLDLNTATEQQLAQIPVLDEYYAAKIVEYRERFGGFYELSELHEIPEMGTFPLDTLQPYVEVIPPA